MIVNDKSLVASFYMGTFPYFQTYQYDILLLEKLWNDQCICVNLLSCSTLDMYMLKIEN